MEATLVFSQYDLEVEEIDEYIPIKIWRCECGEVTEFYSWMYVGQMFSGDWECEECGREYNGSGQLLDSEWRNNLDSDW